MSNEMDLHSSANTPNSGSERVLVYYYATLVLFAALIIYPMYSGIWKAILVVCVLLLAALPILRATSRKRKLRGLRDAQLAEYRTSKTENS